MGAAATDGSVAIWVGPLSIMGFVAAPTMMGASLVAHGGALPDGSCVLLILEGGIPLPDFLLSVSGLLHGMVLDAPGALLILGFSLLF